MDPKSVLLGLREKSVGLSKAQTRIPWREIITTNAIEGFNRQLRKVTKAKSVFPTDDSLLKMLHLAMMDITKKWTGRRQDWSVIHAQMAVYFAERMPE